MPTDIVVNASTSLVMVNTSLLSPGDNQVVLLSSIVNPGALITIRDYIGQCSTNKKIIVSTTQGLNFLDGPQTSSFEIVQPFGFLTVSPKSSTIWSLINTYAFPSQTAANVSNITVTTLNGSNGLFSSIGVNTLTPAYRFDVAGIGRITSTFTSILGIGTTSPTTPLHIETNGSNNGIFMRHTSSTNDSLLTLSNSASGGSLTFHNASGGGSYVLGSAPGDMIARIPQSKRLHFTNTNSEPLLTLSSSAVGIGTTSPTNSILDIAGTLRVGQQAGNTSSFLLNLGTTGVGTFRSAYCYSDGRNMQIANQQPGNLSLITSNTERVTIQSNGFVGIGTTTPDSRLNVNGTTPVIGFGSISPTDSSVINFGITNGTSNVYKSAIISEGINNFYRQKLHFCLNNTADAANVSLSDSRMTILSNGNVGIGTTSPIVTLQTIGDASVYNGTNTTNAGGAVNFGIGTLPSNSPMAQVKGLLINATGSELQGNLAFYTRPNGTAGQSLTERMRILHNGIVGIGQTSPVGMLNIFGTTNYGQLHIEGSGTEVAQFFHQHATANTSQTGWFMGMSGAYTTGNNISTFVILRTESGGNIGNGLAIKADTGNIGIGETNPQYKLEVAGSFKATSLYLNEQQNIQLTNFVPLAYIMDGGIPGYSALSAVLYYTGSGSTLNFTTSGNNDCGDYIVLAPRVTVILYTETGGAGTSQTFINNTNSPVRGALSGVLINNEDSYRCYFN
jgi:hypothetical protein